MSLIRNLLDTSIIEEGMMKLKPQTFDLNKLVEEQIESLQAVAANHRLTWKPAPVSLIHADRERILQVITNFVSNAAKYSPPGSEIIIATEDLLDKAKLIVQDQGPGIPKEAQQFLFERYHRATHSSPEKGFGLGLYICSEIIKQHHGFIGLQSAQGEGATFYFTVPYS